MSFSTLHIWALFTTEMTREFILQNIDQLVRYNIEFVVTGGVAQILRNKKSYTSDLDILVTTCNKNLEQIKTYITQTTNQKSYDLSLLKEGGLLRIRRFPFSIDILSKLDGVETKSAFDTMDYIKFENIEIPVISENLLNLNYETIEKKI